jgi:hypothetical protein
MVWMQVIKTGSTGEKGKREEGEERKCLAQGIVAVTTLGINTNMIM